MFRKRIKNVHAEYNHMPDQQMEKELHLPVMKGHRLLDLKHGDMFFN